MFSRYILLSGIFLLPSIAAAASSNEAMMHVRIEQPSVSSSIPQGAQRVVMLRLSLTAPCSEDAMVESIAIKDSGLGRSEDILRVYAMADNRRISRAHTLKSNDATATIRLRNMNIPACGTVSVSIMADFSPNTIAGSEHRFAVDGASSITANMPVKLSTADVQSTLFITPSSRGSISIDYLSLNAPVRYGADKTVARFQLSADNVSDHAITAMTFTNDGSARDMDLQNLELVLSNGTVISRELDSLDGDTARFVLDPAFLLEKNQTRLVTVRADIRASKRRTIRLIIEEPSDIEATNVRKRR
jgi:hypothetical protein